MGEGKKHEIATIKPLICICCLSLFTRMFLNCNYVCMSTFEFDLLNWADKLTISIMVWWKQVKLLVFSVFAMILQQQ